MTSHYSSRSARKPQFSALPLPDRRRGRGRLARQETGRRQLFVPSAPAGLHRRGDINPSLSVRDGRCGRPIFNCFARRRLSRHHRRADRARRLAATAMTKRKTNAELAREIWDSAQPITGTLVEIYLGSRGISPPDPAPGMPPLRAQAHASERPIFPGDDRAADEPEDRRADRRNPADLPRLERQGQGAGREERAEDVARPLRGAASSALPSRPRASR